MLRFGGENIEKMHLVPKNVFVTAVSNLVKDDTVIEQITEFLLDCQSTEGFYGVDQFFVAVNGKPAVILSFQHLGGDHPHHPDHAEDVIVVLMGHEDMVDMIQRDLHILQNAQDSVSASRVYHKIVIVIVDCEAGVITVGNGGIAGTEYI